MDALGPTSSTQMREEKIAGRLDRCQFGLVFDRDLQHIAVPIEVLPPFRSGNSADALPRLAPEFRLVPGTGREARDAKIDARHFGRSPQPLHASKSSPRPLDPTRIAIDDPEIGNPLALDAEGGCKSALTTADDQNIKDLGTVPIVRDHPFARRKIQMRQLAPHPIRQPGNAHGSCLQPEGGPLRSLVPCPSATNSSRPEFSLRLRMSPMNPRKNWSIPA